MTFVHNAVADLSNPKALFFRISKLGGGFRLSRYLLKRKLLILCFHGFQLADEARFRPQLFMREMTFLKRLEIIRRSGFQVIRLEDALEKLGSGDLPDNTLCITIDDGFVSTLKIAAPILKSFGFPATLYLTSYYSMRTVPIFRLVVQYMFWKTKLKEFAAGNKPWDAKTTVNLMEKNQREKLCWDLIAYGEGCDSEIKRESLCRSLGERLQVDYAELAHSKMLNILPENQLKELRAYGIDVQLHTHRHRFPTNDESRARQEIRENRDYIAKATGSVPRHFCYPSGIWSADQWKWLEVEGVLSAVTCESGFNHAATPRYALHRALDQDDLPDIRFEAMLAGWPDLFRVSTGKRLGANKWPISSIKDSG